MGAIYTRHTTVLEKLGEAKGLVNCISSGCKNGVGQAVGCRNPEDSTLRFSLVGVWTE